MKKGLVVALCCAVYGGFWIPMLAGTFAGDKGTLAAVLGCGLASAAFVPLYRRSEGLGWTIRDRRQGARTFKWGREGGRVGDELSPNDLDVVTESKEVAYWALVATIVALLLCQIAAALVGRAHQQGADALGTVLLGIAGLSLSLQTLAVNLVIADPDEYKAEED